VYGTLVSAAGPLVTAIILVALLAALQLQAGQLRPYLNMSLAFLALLQLSALIFNLLPWPSVDGWGIIAPFLPEAIQAQGRRFGEIGPLLLMLALFFVSPLKALFWDAISGAAALIGLGAWMALQGLQTFQFWRGLF
jgi:Zn-dependent protease